MCSENYTHTVMKACLELCNSDTRVSVIYFANIAYIPYMRSIAQMDIFNYFGAVKKFQRCFFFPFF